MSASVIARVDHTENEKREVREALRIEHEYAMPSSTSRRAG